MGNGHSGKNDNAYGRNGQFDSNISTSQFDPVVTEEHKEISRLRYLNTSLMDENDILRKRNSEEISKVERDTQPLVEEKDSLLKQSQDELQEERERNENIVQMIQNKHKDDIERQTDEGNRVRNKYLEEISTLQEEKNALQTRYLEEISTLQDSKNALQTRYLEEISTLQESKNALQTRFSAIAGAKLTDGNANIADLSDENRPTKLAEHYSGLYNNEWTDAFEVLTSGEKRSDESALHILAKAFCVAYRTCTEKATNDMRSLTLAMRAYYGRDDIPTDILKQLKDERKKSFGGQMASLIPIFKKNSKALFGDDPARKTPQINTFLLKSLEICWLMAVQDPPVYVDVDLQSKGDRLDTHIYRTYTRTGSYIDFVVWPALYLQRGGALLLKGVAQGTDTRDNISGEPEQAQTGDLHESANSSSAVGSSQRSKCIDLKTWQNITQTNESLTQNQGNITSNTGLSAAPERNVTKVSIHI